MPSCAICKVNSGIKVKLSCEHYCCLSCATHPNPLGVVCSHCGVVVSIDKSGIDCTKQKKNVRYQWLYGAGHSSNWWAYTIEHNKQLEKGYKLHKKTDGCKARVDVLFDPVAHDLEYNICDLATEEMQSVCSIYINNQAYLINYDTMQQINKDDPTRSRDIMRVYLPKCELTNWQLYLKNTYSVAGMAGVRF